MAAPEEFEQFVRARSSALLRTAYALTGDRGHAEDLLQVVLARVYRRWRSVQLSPEAYARQALVRESANRWRWRSRRPAERAWRPGEDVADRDRAGVVEQRDSIVAALRQLPQRQRAAIVLRFLDDLTEAETAAALGCSVGTVKSQTSRGLANLREHFHLTQLMDRSIA